MPFVPLQDLTPRFILPKPDNPALVELLDQLQHHFNEANRLRREIEQRWIEMNRADSERFQMIQSEMSLRVGRGGVNSQPKPRVASKPQTPKRRASWKDSLFGGK